MEKTAHTSFSFTGRSTYVPLSYFYQLSSDAVGFRFIMMKAMTVTIR